MGMFHSSCRGKLVDGTLRGYSSSKMRIVDSQTFVIEG